MKKVLLEPFEHYAEKKLLGIGILGTLIGCFIAYAFHARYDGVLDVHFVEHIKIYHPFLDNSINIITLSLLLFICGKIINKKTRLIDILNATLIARLPYFFISFANINNYMVVLSKKLLTFDMAQPQLLPFGGVDLLLLLAFAFISLLLLVYFLYLLYKGYQIATNAKGALPIGLFILAILLAEVISKFLIYTLYS